MAKAALENSQWMSKLSDELQIELTKVMVPLNAPEGHVFVREGQPVDSFHLVESGTLLRTKRVGEEDEEEIEIDSIGPGRLSGFLHAAGTCDDEIAYATISAGKGGAKVWVVPGKQFRKLCNENPEYSAEVIKVRVVFALCHKLLHCSLWCIVPKHIILYTSRVGAMSGIKVHQQDNARHGV